MSPNQRPVTQTTADRRQDLESPSFGLDISYVDETHDAGESYSLQRVAHGGIHDGQSPVCHLRDRFDLLQNLLVGKVLRY